MNTNEMRKLAEALAAPFEPEEVQWKPQAVSGNRALAVAYINARTVMDRLDEVMGVGYWQDDYHETKDGQVVCRLHAWINNQWIVKCDVGGQSEQPDEGDRLKAAFSEALKRAAVKLGIGRYLYSLPKQWCDYDPQKKQFTKQPQLPGWAIPKKPDPNVTSTQARELSDLIRATGDRQLWDEFKERYRVERCDDLPAVHYADAKAYIEKRAPVKQAG